MSLELVPLCTFSAKLTRPDMVADTPVGHRIVAGIESGRLEGDRLKADQRGVCAADWLIIGSDGTAIIDVRVTFRTDDGAYVFMEYGGRGDWSAGPMTAPVYSTPRFETGDERYAWLNKIQAVGKGAVVDGGAQYELFELR